MAILPRKKRTITPQIVQMTKDKMERVNRTSVYKPAKVYVHWLFLASVATLLADAVAAFHAWQLGGLPGFLDSMWYVVPMLAAGGFGFSKALMDQQIASGFFLMEGDRGFINLDSLDMRHPILAQETFDVVDDERKRAYPPELWGRKVTRYEVWRWGRRGGVWKWPYADGGKRDGYWAVVQHSWDVCEIPASLHAKMLDREVTLLMAQVVTIQDQIRKYEKEPNKLVPWISGQPLTTYADRVNDRERTFLAREVSEEWRKRLPGVQRGRTLDLRYVTWPERSPMELPEEVALQIMSDSEYRISSLVTVGYDPLPEEVYMGSVAPPNALARLWGMETANKVLTERILNLQNQVGESRILSDIIAGGVSLNDLQRAVGTGQQPPT